MFNKSMIVALSIMVIPFTATAHDMISITKIVPEYDYINDTEVYNESTKLIDINKDTITSIEEYDGDGYGHRYELCLTSGYCFLIDENTKNELK